MARVPFVGGNWKMNGSAESNAALVTMLNEGSWNIDVVVAPSTIHLLSTKAGLTKAKVSAQNIYSEAKGAFTGETSPDMLVDAGIEWTLLGHSERRHIFGETDEDMTKKVKALMERPSLQVMACIGEKKEAREGGETDAVLAVQLAAFAAGITAWDRVVIAYEPVWAIGTGLAATPDMAQDTHLFVSYQPWKISYCVIHCCAHQIRKWLAENVSGEVASATRILYGGSVSAKNCEELIGKDDIDGFLVGGASLKPDFMTIIAAGESQMP
jgi:triosephosphate isomerase